MVRRIFPAAVAALLCLTLASCVAGYGRCLFLQPARSTLTGRVQLAAQFPLLTLDETAYVYAPASSSQCTAVRDLELVLSGAAMEKVPDGARVTVRGAIFEDAGDRHATRFAMDVLDVVPAE